MASKSVKRFKPKARMWQTDRQTTDRLRYRAMYSNRRNGLRCKRRFRLIIWRTTKVFAVWG